MSEDALIKTIEVEMKVLISGGNDYIMVIPGNYGKIFSQNELGIPDRKSLKCSNYIGATVDLAAGLGVKGILFVGHIGKLIKLSGGIMNTHSREADCRMELMAAAALRAGAGSAAAAEILDAGTTDEGIRILKENGCLEAAMDHIMDRIAFYLNHRCMGRMETEAMVFSNVYGILGQTKGAAAMLSRPAVRRKRGIEGRTMKDGILYGVGVGPGDPELLTCKAVRIIRQADVIALPAETKENCVAYRIARGAVKEIDEKEFLFIPMPMTKDRAVLKESHDNGARAVEACLREGKQVAFLTLGDVRSTLLICTFTGGWPRMDFRRRSSMGFRPSARRRPDWGSAWLRQRRSCTSYRRPMARRKP